MYIDITHKHTYTYIHTYCHILVCILIYMYISTSGLERHMLTAFARLHKSCVFRNLNRSFCLGIRNFSKTSWNSDYRQRFPLKSTEFWRYRIQTFCVLSLHLQFQALSTPLVDIHKYGLSYICI